VNEADILGMADNDIVFQVHNIEEIVRNVEKHGDDDQYSNCELGKYKKITEDSKKPLYHDCAIQYTILFMMVKLFQLKVSNGWSDGSFKDLLTLLKDMLPQGNVVPETVYEAKTDNLSVRFGGGKNPRVENDCILYHGDEYEDLEKCPSCGLDQFNRRKDDGDDENCNRRNSGPKMVF
jgi:hypothetical protein